jgi:hypothetical protein
VGLQPTGLSRGGITKTGDRHPRQLLVAAGLIHRADPPGTRQTRDRTLVRRPARPNAGEEGRPRPSPGQAMRSPTKWPASPGPCSSSKPPTAHRPPNLPPRRPSEPSAQSHHTPPPGNPMRGRWKLTSTDRSHRGSAQPEPSLSFASVAMIRGADPRPSSGPAATMPRTPARHMTAPGSACPSVAFSLARRGPSTHDSGLQRSALCTR